MLLTTKGGITVNIMKKRVKVVSGYYKENEGIVTGVTLDGYWLVTPKSKNSFFAKTEELVVLTKIDKTIN